MPFSPKQIDFLKTSTHSYNIASGPVRSGKTYSQILRWYDYIYNECIDNVMLIMSGKTSESLYDNVLSDFIALDPDDLIYSSQPQSIYVKSKNIKIKCVGANDQSAMSKIQGLTAQGWLADEIVIHPKDFIKMAITRCSSGKRSKFWTCNPDAPTHFIKTDFIENEDIDIKTWYFNLLDNPVLSDEYKEELKNSFSGPFYERMIMGRWVLAEGVVYNEFSRDVHYKDIPFHQIDHSIFREYVLGIDWGYEDPMAILLIGIDNDSCYHYLDEFYQNHTLVDNHLYNELKRMGWFTIGNNNQQPVYAYADSASPSDIRQFNNLTGIPTIGARKGPDSVIDGIKLVQNKYKTDENGKTKAFIYKNCKNFLREKESYHWKLRKDGSGKDDPDHSDSHSQDAERYVIFTREYGRVKHIKDPRR